MSTTMTETEVLTDARWAQVRDEATQRFLGISAAEFVERFHAGDYDVDAPEALMTVLGYFPELD